ncbi:MAG TPA: MFS transporter [Alphaproteobacteria bacterium]|jgi:MFS family permease|nr:MFS transporter [Alphaproteobacteria bacterium]
MLSAFQNMFGVLTQRNYGVNSAGYVPALITLWAQRVGVGWLAWSLTQSPTWLGLMAAADLLPAVLISPIAGALVDRVHPLRMTVISQVVAAAQGIALWVMTALGWIDIWSLWALAIVLGINNPFTTSARMNLLPLMVKPQEFPTAIAINSTLFNLARIIGPTVAGTVIAAWDVDLVFLLNAIAQLIFLGTIFLMKLLPAPPIPQRKDGGVRGLIADIHEGIVYSFRHAGTGPLFVMLVLTAVSSRPVVDMLPGFADEVFKRGAAGLGWLGSAIGAGGILSAIWLAARSSTAGLTRIVAGNSLVVGLALVGFALVHNFWIALVFLAIAGASMVISGAGTQTLLQSSVDNAMRGRVMALYSLLYRGMPALGSLIMGMAAEVIGLEAAVAVGSVLCIGTWWRMRGRERAMAEALEKNPGTR